MAYCRSGEVVWEDDAYVGWFPYVISSCEVLDIPAPEVTAANITASDVPVKKFVGVVSVVIQPGCRKTLVQAADAVRSVLHFSTPSPDLSANLFFVKDEIVEE